MSVDMLLDVLVPNSAYRLRGGVRIFLPGHPLRFPRASLQRSLRNVRSLLSSEQSLWLRSLQPMPLPMVVLKYLQMPTVCRIIYSVLVLRRFIRTRFTRLLNADDTLSTDVILEARHFLYNDIMCQQKQKKKNGVYSEKLCVMTGCVTQRC